MLKTIKLRLFFLTIILSGFGNYSQAIRLVLNGGGVAEMVAISSFSQIPQIILTAKTQSDVLNLSDKEVSFLNDISSEKFFNISEVEIDFFNPLATNEDVIYYANNPNRISISEKKLYDQNGKAKNSTLIAKNVFIAWLNNPNLNFSNIEKLNESDLNLLTDKIYSNFTFSSTAHYLQSPNHKVWVNNINSSSGLVLSSRLAIETDSNYSDVTNFATSTIPCHHLSDISDLTFSQFSQIQDQLKGNMSWTCNNERFEAIIIAPMAQLLNFPLQTIQFTLVNLNKIFISCGENLR